MNEIPSVEEGLLRGFLLGALPDADRDQIEQRLLVDDHLYQLLVATEEELLDEWARGSLEPREARSLLGYLEKLPGGHARMDFARHFAALTERKDEAGSSPESAGAGAKDRVALYNFADWLTSARPAAWMTAACLLIALSVVFLVEAPSQLPGESPVSPRPDPPSILLTPGMTRGGGSLPVVAVFPPGSFQELRLDLGTEEFARYRAVLHDADATELFAASGLRPEETSERMLVVFAIPSEQLRPGDYFVSLYGSRESGRFELLHQYAFRAASR